jgi:hypothetical protein
MDKDDLNRHFDDINSIIKEIKNLFDLELKKNNGRIESLEDPANPTK